MAFDDGVLVSRRWLERVDQALFGYSQNAHENNGAASLFYDVRPAVLASAWTQNAAGLWIATAMFIVNDAVDPSFIFDVVAPTATNNPSGTAGATRFFVVWRGRWELLAPPGRLMTKTVATGLVANVSDDGWLTLSTPGTTIRYYGEPDD